MAAWSLNLVRIMAIDRSGQARRNRGYAAATIASVLVLLPAIWLIPRLSQLAARPTPTNLRTIPSEIADLDWLAPGSDTRPAAAGTLGGSYLELPSSETALAARNGLVVSVDKAASPPGGSRHVTVRDISTGSVLAAADFSLVELGAVVVGRAVYVSGPSPATGGQPGVPATDEVPGLWRLESGSSVNELIPPNAAPSEWIGARLTRRVLATPSGTRLITAVCRSDGFHKDNIDCAGALIDATTGRMLKDFGDLGGRPILATEDLVIVQRPLSAGVVALDLSTVEVRWRASTGEVDAAYLDDAIVVVSGSQRDSQDTRFLATIDTNTGQLHRLLEAPQSDLGILYPELSAGRFAVLFDWRVVSSGVDPGSRIRVFDITTGTYLLEAALHGGQPTT
jgi:hypothetical protein